MLTHSRGGFLALMACVGVLLHSRFGMKKTLLLGALVLPVLLVVFAGRMTTISTGEDTAQSRIQLWSDGLTFFQSSPLTGVGADNYTKYSSHVAHNSFIHCYTELGLFGGTFFVAPFTSRCAASTSCGKPTPRSTGAAAAAPVTARDGGGLHRRHRLPLAQLCRATYMILASRPSICACTPSK